MAERLSLEMECHDDGVVLRLAGRLDARTVPLLAGVLRAVLGGIWGPVDVDLEGVSSIDGAGIGVLLEAEEASQRDGHALAVSGVRESLRRQGELDQYARQARQTL